MAMSRKRPPAHPDGFGPDIQPGVHLDTARLVDEAPTFAHALGLTMPDTDGHCLTELFR